MIQGPGVLGNVISDKFHWSDFDLGRLYQYDNT